MAWNDFADPSTFTMGADMAPVQTTAVNNQGAAPVYQPVSVSGAAGAAAQPVMSPGGTQAGVGAGKGGFFQPGGGASLILGGIQTLGSLWNSFQQNKLAKKSFALQERAFETNLANQTKTYNTALEDRINARYATEGRSQEAAGYIDKNKL